VLASGPIAKQGLSAVLENSFKHIVP
jgi:hypothetical protein